MSYLLIMFNLTSLSEKAKHSSFHRWMFNVLMGFIVPFNRPHKFRIVEVGDHHLKVLLPYRKKNLNHIRGLHACALATLTEFTSGLLLILKLGMSDYRIILKRLTIDYHYQGKMDAVAEFTLTEEWIEQNIKRVLLHNESAVINCEVKIYDVKGNHLTTGVAEWQLKDWRKVRTKA